MSPWIVFLIGLLLGWLIEWIIDWVYWRKKENAEVSELNSKLDDAQKENSALKEELENCGEVRVDPLEKIKGIGPVIKRKLNEGGIFSFAQLGSLTAKDLEEIVGDEVKRLADEDELIRQAQEFAQKN
jgi:predicted flap endonuclease-1-like 5' DNA nuclease